MSRIELRDFANRWDGRDGSESLKVRVAKLVENRGQVGDFMRSCNTFSPVFDMRQYGFGNHSSLFNINVQKSEEKEEEKEEASLSTIVGVALAVGAVSFGLFWSVSRTYKDAKLDGELEAEQAKLEAISVQPDIEQEFKTHLAGELGISRSWMQERLHFDRMLLLTFGALGVGVGAFAREKLKARTKWTYRLKVGGALVGAISGAGAAVLYPSQDTRSRVEAFFLRRRPEMIVTEPHPPAYGPPPPYPWFTTS